MKTTDLQTEFLDILEKNKKLLFKIAHAYCQVSEERQDLIQEITLQLWKAFPNYKPEFALSTWMYRIALNVSISYTRKVQSRKKTDESYRHIVQLQDWDEEEKSAQLKLLHCFIEQLKPLDKALIILFLEGHDNLEIANIMGISQSNVSTKMYRIKKQLKSNFEQKKTVK